MLQIFPSNQATQLKVITIQDFFFCSVLFELFLWFWHHKTWQKTFKASLKTSAKVLKIFKLKTFSRGPHKTVSVMDLHAAVATWSLWSDRTFFVFLENIKTANLRLHNWSVASFCTTLIQSSYYMGWNSAEI